MKSFLSLDHSDFLVRDLSDLITPFPRNSYSPFPAEYDATAEKEMIFLDNSSINIVFCGDSLYTNYSSDYFEHKNNDFLIINLKKLTKMKILSEEEITSMKKKFVDIILKF